MPRKSSDEPSDRDSERPIQLDEDRSDSESGKPVVKLGGGGSADAETGESMDAGDGRSDRDSGKPVQLDATRVGRRRAAKAPKARAGQTPPTASGA